MVTRYQSEGDGEESGNVSLIFLSDLYCVSLTLYHTWYHQSPIRHRIPLGIISPPFVL